MTGTQAKTKQRTRIPLTYSRAEREEQAKQDGTWPAIQEALRTGIRWERFGLCADPAMSDHWVTMGTRSNYGKRWNAWAVNACFSCPVLQPCRVNLLRLTRQGIPPVGMIMAGVVHADLIQKQRDRKAAIDAGSSPDPDSPDPRDLVHIGSPDLGGGSSRNPLLPASAGSGS